MLGAGEALGVGAALGCVDQIDRHEPLGEGDRGLHRLREARAQVLAHHEPVDDDLDRVLELLVERRGLVEQVELAVDLDPRKALVAEMLEGVAVLALAIANDGGVHREARPLGEREDLFDDRIHRLTGEIGRPQTGQWGRPARA